MVVLTKTEFKAVSSWIRLSNRDNLPAHPGARRTRKLLMNTVSPILYEVGAIHRREVLLQLKRMVLARYPRLTERQQRIKHLSGRHSGPVFYINHGTDCDGVNAGRALEFENQMVADEFIEGDIEWADGPTYWVPVDKAEHDAFEAWSTDTFAAAAGY